MAQSALRDSSPPRGLLPVWIRLHERRETVVVLVTANNTVLDVKDVINKTENILQEQQHLLCGTTRFRKQVRAKHASVLDDARTIGSYLPLLESRSSSDNTIDLYMKDTIFVTNLISGTQLQLNVKLNYDSLEDVKEAIEEQTKIPVAWQHFMLHGELLWFAPLMSLGNWGIHEGETLDLVVSSA
jgi:hypothetical protein